MIQQFNFYKSYADIIIGLSHTEAGAYIKEMCEYMFRDKEIDAVANDKAGSLLSLSAEDLAEEKQAAERNVSIGKERHFSFKAAYANVLLLLKDSESGILIKQICAYMFGGEQLSEEEMKTVIGYYTAIKKHLARSKRQSENARKKPVTTADTVPKLTLDSIKTEFNLNGNLREDHPILDGVSLVELKKYLQETPTMRNVSIYRAIEKHKEARMKKD